MSWLQIVGWVAVGVVIGFGGLAAWAVIAGGGNRDDYWEGE